MADQQAWEYGGCLRQLRREAPLKYKAYALGEPPRGDPSRIPAVRPYGE